jgi:hypothetical protein
MSVINTPEAISEFMESQCARAIRGILTASDAEDEAVNTSIIIHEIERVKIDWTAVGDKWFEVALALHRPMPDRSIRGKLRTARDHRLRIMPALLRPLLRNRDKYLGTPGASFAWL